MRDEHERAAGKKERDTRTRTTFGRDERWLLQRYENVYRMNVSGEQLYKNVVSCGGTLV